MNKTSEEYRLATEISMFLADKLNEHGIKTVVVTEEKAKEALERERMLAGQGRSNVEFSMRDIMTLSYTWNGEEVSMRGFAEQFMSEIKQKDRTIEDAERIAKAFIEAVKADPEKAGMKMLKAENMANAFRFKLPDGTIYTPEHPMAASPEYETQKGLWEIYEYVLGKETMREFIGLLSRNAPMSLEERKRYSELESRVNGSDIMQRSLEIPASKVNENRVKDIRNLIQYFEGNDDYTWTEKALIVKGAMSFGYSEKKEADSTRIEIKNISDNNSVSVPVIGGEAAAVVEGLRKGLNFKEALVQARVMLSKESKRSVGGNFTGWKAYKQSDKEEDAVVLNQDVAGTGWCTGGAVSTARSHLSGGDFHVYYEAGEPLIAIRTENGRMAEPPRGAHEGQFCTDREEQIAFDYVRSGNGIIAGDDYIADIEDIRRIMSPNATLLDAFLMPEKRRYENGEYGGDTSAWGKSVEQRIAELVPDKKEERWKLGLYYGNEIEDACKNGNAIAIKGTIELIGSASLTLSEGVTLVEDIVLRNSASLTLPESVTRVGNIELVGSTTLTLLEGVTQVRKIVLRNSASLTIPESVTQVREINLYDSASLTLPEGVTQVGCIHLRDSTSLTLPEGVTQVNYIGISYSASLTLPESVTRVGNIELVDSASLTLPEGVAQVGDISLYDSTSLILPQGVKQVGDIRLGDSASLTLPEGVTKVEDIALSDSAYLTLPESMMQVGGIYLIGSTSLTLPEGVTQVGNIYLGDSASLTLPENVTQVGDITLFDSTSLVLPKGVTQVGDIILRNFASLILPEGVTQVGKIELYSSATLTLPEGVTQVGEISLYGYSSLTLPEGMTQVGNIRLGDSASLTLPEGVTQVEDIALFESASLTLPESVTQVREINLYDSASLTLPDGVTQVGNINLYYSASLTLPEGMTQVGGIYLNHHSTVTFPDGFVLSTPKAYSAKEINQLLSEHQKKQEFRLADGTIYGYQQGETIYLTPAGINPNTPIHEYAHLWAKVYEMLRPEEWGLLKKELKATPQWVEIASSTAYSFIDKDENRLAGEVLATIVGNKGEELLLSAASKTLEEEERADDSVIKGAEHFREMITEMAVKDVFNAEGMEYTGEVTLKVLKDLAEGKGVKIRKNEGEKLAAMAGLSPKELRREDLRRKAEKSFNRQIGTLGFSSNNNLLNNGQKRR